MTDPSRPIHRSSRDRLVAGVCGGLGDWLGWDPSVVRVVYVLATAVTGFIPGLVGYLVLWLILRPEPARPLARPDDPSRPAP